jgi:hypothetical protein
MKAKVSDKGWVVEITNTVYGMLEQGGICGRVELWTWDALKSIGLQRSDTPECIITCRDGDQMTGLDYLKYHRREFLDSAPRKTVRVLRRGHIIQ